MAFPNGPLAGYFKTNDAPAPISPHQQNDLFVDTRGLIGPFLGNTVFCRGVLAFSFVRAVPAFTICSHRNLGNVPYLVTELGGDVRAGRLTGPRMTSRLRTRSVGWPPTWATSPLCLSWSSSRTARASTT